MLCEKGVLLLILFFARAETQKIESCENYSYKSVKGDNVSVQYTYITWDALIAAVPILNSTDISCSVFDNAEITILAGKLVDILVNIPGRKNLVDEGSYNYDLLKNLLGLSSDFQSFIMIIKDTIAPVVLEESLFLHNKQLKKLVIELTIQEIRENTFLYLENLKELELAGCRLEHFNPNELPSSLESLNLQDYRLKTFELTKPLVALLGLDLSDNLFTRFVLDLRYLPKITSVSLYKNQITDFQPIDHNLNHTLRVLLIHKNQIRNLNAFEWFMHKRNISKIEYELSFPVCDCSSQEMLKIFSKKNITRYCILPVPGRVIVDIHYFKCPANDSRDSSCTNFSDSFIPTTIVFNCSNTVGPPEIDLRSVTIFKDWHFYFSGNRNIKVLPEFPDISDAKNKIHIYAENANLRTLFSARNFPKQNLDHLYLANNSIDEISVEMLEKLFEMETHLTLAKNPLICDCQHKSMYETLTKMAFLIDDFNETTCNDGLPFADRDLCFAWELLILYSFLVLFAILTCFLIIFLRYTLEIQVYIYSRGWFPAYFRTEPDEANYKYDVFVSYSDKDEEFVVSVIHFLEEQVSPPFKVCHHHRDWIVGERIDRQIITSVEESRKTIIILSPNFLTSIWTNMEFRTALYTMLEEKTPKLVLIIHGDIGPTKQLKPEIRSYIKTTTYLASDDKWFWKKLTYSLRRPSKKENPESVIEGTKSTGLDIKEEDVTKT